MAIVSANGAAAPLSPNYLINGAFEVNQRAFSTSISTANVYGYDRWYLNAGGGTFSYAPNTFATGACPVVGFDGTGYARLSVSGQSTGQYCSLNQRIENVATAAGQTVVVSVYAKATIDGKKLGVYFGQGFGTGGSTTVYTYSSAATLTTSWARYSFVINLPSIAGKTIGTSSFVEFGISASDAYNPSVGAQDAIIDIAFAQVELGSVATPFRRNGASIADEVSSCQRYYLSTSLLGLVGHFYNSTQASYNITFPAAMRVAPSIGFNGAFVTYSASASGRTTTMSVVGSNTVMAQFVGTLTNTSTTSGYASHLDNGASNALTLNAELS